MSHNELDLSVYQASFLHRTFQNRMKKLEIASVDDYQEYLNRTEEERNILEEELQVSYSAFFRNTLSFATLEHIVFPRLLQRTVEAKARELRIWSSACASGQECYSLAILLEEMLTKAPQPFTYRIFATDKSDAQIKQATMGSYPVEVIKSLSMERIQKWFTKQGETYTVLERIKERIDFSTFDLFNQNLTCPPVSIFGDFDLIVCANLLFYFEPKHQQVIIDKVTRCLAPGSYLMSGETERDLLLRQGFREISFGSAIFEHKGVL